uniref:Uncharacterized protein n=1 Tax=Timema monikensis TaxID=170555 RepID=A0A7R9HNK7_9NEOP|nr:unnamed protein product [Timema monikensis]
MWTEYLNKNPDFLDKSKGILKCNNISDILNRYETLLKTRDELTEKRNHLLETMAREKTDLIAVKKRPASVATWSKALLSRQIRLPMKGRSRTMPPRKLHSLRWQIKIYKRGGNITGQRIHGTATQRMHRGIRIRRGVQRRRCQDPFSFLTYVINPFSLYVDGEQDFAIEDFIGTVRFLKTTKEGVIE